LSQQRRLPDATDLRRMCILTKTDLNRIYENLDRRQRDKDAIEQEIARKKELAERSAEMTKHWPNTIAVNKSIIECFVFLLLRKFLNFRVHENVNLN